MRQKRQSQSRASDPRRRARAAVGILAAISLMVLGYSCSIADRGRRSAVSGTAFARRVSQPSAPKPQSSPREGRRKPSAVDHGAPFIEGPAPDRPVPEPGVKNRRRPSAGLRAKISALERRRSALQDAARHLQAAANSLRSPRGLEPALSVGVTYLATPLTQDAPGISAPLPALLSVSGRMSGAIDCLRRLPGSRTFDEAELCEAPAREALKRLALVSTQLESARSEGSAALGAMLDRMSARDDRRQEAALREILAGYSGSLEKAASALRK